MDALAFTYALLGGAFMGSYSVPIKSPAVLEARVHAIVFQWYKSVWVLVAGFLAIALRSLWSASAYHFTWWAFASTAAWIPSGICTIAAVPRVGVGMTSVVSTGCASLLSFLVFWLVLGEDMRLHGPPGHQFYMAPVYMASLLAGMIGVMWAPKAPVDAGWGSARYGVVPSPTSIGASCCPAAAPSDADAAPGKSKDPQTERSIFGLGLAAVAGAFAAAQFGLLTVGKRSAMAADGCLEAPSACSEALKEQFNTFGSWLASFGLGSVLLTGVYSTALFSMESAMKGQVDLPPFHVQVTGRPGSVAGISWVLGFCFQSAAVARGGNAIMMPVNCAVQLLTSSLWGMLYYREIRDCKRAVLWGLAVFWTLCSVILLSGEKAP